MTQTQSRKRSVSGQLTRVIFVGKWAACLLAYFVGVTPTALVIAVLLYWGRMFFITAGYHRYFAHRTYHTSRACQFLLALGGCLAMQKGPLWWAWAHRRHHKYSDQPGDPHSVKLNGFWWSHLGWILSNELYYYQPNQVIDLYQFPELRWLDKYHWVPPLVLAVWCYLVAGGSGLIVGFGWSTFCTDQATFSINSLAHIWGSRPYPTGDESRNNLWLALLTMGEGWHNNHHYYQRSTRQGFYWWQVDITYYILRLLAWGGLVWGMGQPPKQVLEK